MASSSAMGGISSVSFYKRDKTLPDYMTGRVLRREGANEIVAHTVKG